MYYGPVMIDVQGKALNEAERALLKHPNVGGVLLFTRNFESKKQVKQLIEDIRKAAAHPILIAVDHEGGRIWRFNEEFTKIQAAREYGQCYEQDPKQAKKLAQESGYKMAKELLECGLDLSFAPVLDLDKVSEVIGDRAFHATPNVVSELATSFIDGMNQAGMQATGKHFPGHGSVVADSHLKEVVDTRLLSDIKQEDMIPFAKLSPKLGAIMPAHIIFPQVDSVPTGYSAIWLQTILRKELNFDGAVISDCLSMQGAAMGGDFVLRARMALDAGCDMVILTQQDTATQKWVLDKLERSLSKESERRLKKLAAQKMASIAPVTGA